MSKPGCFRVTLCTMKVLEGFMPNTLYTLYNVGAGGFHAEHPLQVRVEEHAVGVKFLSSLAKLFPFGVESLELCACELVILKQIDKICKSKNFFIIGDMLHICVRQIKRVCFQIKLSLDSDLSLFFVFCIMCT